MRVCVCVFQRILSPLNVFRSLLCVTSPHTYVTLLKVSSSLRVSPTDLWNFIFCVEHPENGIHYIMHAFCVQIHFVMKIPENC